MKRFYYTEERHHNRKRNNRTGSIYTIKNGKLEYCCDYAYTTGSCRGGQSEVFQTLMENGFIPRKWENSSKTAWSGAGYFMGEITEHYEITQIG